MQSLLYSCTYCLSEKPIVAFPALPWRGPRPCCACRAETERRAAAAWRERNRRAAQARAEARALRPLPPPYVPPLEKACTHCKAVKPLAEFGNGACRDGKDSWCRACVNAANSLRTKTLRATDPEWRAASAQAKRDARRRADPALAARDAERAARAALRADHDRHVRTYRAWLAACDAHVTAYRSLPRPAPVKPPRKTSAQPAYYERAKSAYRRARRLGRTVPWCLLRDTVSIYEKAARLEELTGVEWHVDHEYPLRGELVSGLHTADNLQAIPRCLNEAKKNLFIPREIAHA